MTAEEFAWWVAMIELEWIGPARQARLLAHVAAASATGARLKAPDGSERPWHAGDFIAPDRWQPPLPPETAQTPAARRARGKAIRSFFDKFFA